ncbi:hypothetical protein NDU88_006184 [Pleurodeles waltl]|uniref:Uncharacterized protein n=1 Tax=Pleurodeles waltl TaxID=8319 RepID=A0AAV7SP39_PLEWA|nr:hypothetical protein NDU88_006184 [Pleurodeles waltl]
MDEIPDPDVLRSGTNQAELPGEEGQKKAIRPATNGSEEKKAERGGRDGDSDGNGERISSSDGRSEDSKPRERDSGGEPGDGREEKGRGSSSGSLEEESDTGRRSRKPGGSSTNPGHVLGRARPQQVSWEAHVGIRRTVSALAAGLFGVSQNEWQFVHRKSRWLLRKKYYCFKCLCAKMQRSP